VECIPIPDKKELVMTAIDQFAAHVGLDWADKKHDVCVQFKNGERITVTGLTALNKFKTTLASRQ